MELVVSSGLTVKIKFELNEIYIITDSSSDANFYANPRLVTHIDDYAIQALTQFYREHLTEG